MSLSFLGPHKKGSWRRTRRALRCWWSYPTFPLQLAGVPATVPGFQTSPPPSALLPWFSCPLFVTLRCPWTGQAVSLLPLRWSLWPNFSAPVDMCRSLQPPVQNWFWRRTKVPRQTAGKNWDFDLWLPNVYCYMLYLIWLIVRFYIFGNLSLSITAIYIQNPQRRCKGLSRIKLFLFVQSLSWFS